MKIAVLMLCHEAPAAIARRLGSAFYRSPDVKVYLHHDRKSPHHDRAAFAAALPADVQWQWLDDAVACRWGEYSLVEATLRLMRAALGDAAFAPDHLLHASGSCRPIRALATLQAFLREREGVDFIEAQDISRARWTKDGLERERFEWYFPFNYATHRRWFELFNRLQRRLGIRRRLPAGLRPHFGSQWFCLTAETARRVVEAMARPGLARFFASTWIPDEFALQTVVANLEPAPRIAGHGLTYYEFDGQGKPLVLEDWHVDHVVRQPYFFARKISSEAPRLEAALESVVAGGAGVDTERGWFARVGTPTPEFGRFLARVREDRSLRSRVGGFSAGEGGPMAANTRRYYVLVGASPAYVARVLAGARALAARTGGAPILDFPFTRQGFQPAPDRLSWYGLGPCDRLRMRYDELGALYELVRLDPHQCTAFGLDAGGASPVRAHIARDPHAVLVDCDPPGLTRAQRAAMALRHLGGTHEAWLSLSTRRALATGARLPQDYFAVLRAHDALRCRFVRLAEVTTLDDDDPTWRLLTAAAAGIHEGEFVMPPALAAALVGEAVRPTE
jgi:hypothetical protein